HADHLRDVILLTVHVNALRDSNSTTSEAWRRFGFWLLTLVLTYSSHHFFFLSFVCSLAPFPSPPQPLLCYQHLPRDLLVKLGAMPTNTSAEDDVLHSPRPSQNESLYCTSDDDDAATLDITAFSNDGFSDFKLDLTCLVSPPPSPPQPASPQLHPVSSISSSAARRSVSFSSPAPIGSIVRPASAPRLGLGFGSTTAMGAPTGTNSSSSPRLSFTLPMTANCSRLGRGTPIDPGRRSEWAGHGGVDLGAREDGVLFSTVRSSSGSFLFDGSGGGDARSESPLTEWNYVSPVPVRAASLQLLQPLPKICLAGIDDTEGGSASASLSEWVSSTQKMFASPSTVSLPPVSPMTTQYESARESVEDVSSQHQHQPQEQEQEPQPQPDLLGMSLVRRACRTSMRSNVPCAPRIKMTSLPRPRAALHAVSGGIISAWFRGGRQAGR
ncbi:unnamed protein product, partial [Mycena citricolor]